MRLSSLFVLLAAGTTACADPQGGFDAFNQRYTADQPPVSDAGPAGDGGTCAPPAVGTLDGEYYFTLSAKLNPVEPVVMTIQLTTAEVSGGLTFSGTVQALSAHDRITPVGTTTAIGPFDVSATGGFDAMLPMLTTIATANPLVAADLVSQVNLIGDFCTPDGFYCGQVTGSVSKPIPIADLTGSTFTMQLVKDPTKLPAPLIDCAKDPASAPTM
jgi:hypothetical protein